MLPRYVSIFPREIPKLYNLVFVLQLLPIKGSSKNSNIPIRNSKNLRDCLLYGLDTTLPTDSTVKLKFLLFVSFTNNRFTTDLALCRSFQSTAKMSGLPAVAPGASAMKVQYQFPPLDGMRQHIWKSLVLYRNTRCLAIVISWIVFLGLCCPGKDFPKGGSRPKRRKVVVVVRNILG